jgi:hypothetical protein
MEVTLAIIVTAPNTRAVYSIGKYSEVTRKHRLKALETPNLVSIKLNNINIF